MWKAGFDAERVDSARNTIISIGEEAVYYLITKKLIMKDRLGVRAIRDICQKAPAYCTRGILEVLNTNDSVALKNALFVSGEVEIPGISGKLLEILKKQREGVWISRTLRSIYRSGDDRICKVLKGYTEHPYEYVRMRSALLIGEKGCENLKWKLWDMLKDSVFTVRDAAKISLVKMGFSLKEFEREVERLPEHEIMKLLYLRCPSRDYIEVTKKRVSSDIFEIWKEFVTCN